MLAAEVPGHRARDLAGVVVLKSFFKLELDPLVLRDKLLLEGEDHTFGLLLVKEVHVDGHPLLLLLGKPVLALHLHPLGQELLGLGVRLDEDCVLVEPQVVHGLEAGEDRLNAVELGEAEGLRLVRVGRRAAPGDQGAARLEQSF